MDLPAELRAALGRALEPASAAALGRIAEQQSDVYRTRKPGAYAAPVVTRSDDALAYAAWRMPATYGAIAAALDAVSERRPDFEPSSQLDLGSGPGTAIWAAWARLGAIERVVGLEQSGAFRDLAGRLVAPPDGGAEPPGAGEGHSAHPQAEWHATDLADAARWPGLEAEPRFDLVTVCYVTGELAEAARARLLERAWTCCRDVLLVVEPGTSAGYQRLMAMRDALLRAGAHVVAPCPHAAPCPLEAGDWCHFAERVSRSRIHRRVKGADLGYEDEKYAYLAVARQAPARAPAARVLRAPDVHKAAVELTLCTPTGLAKTTVRRRDKAGYRVARKLRAGDVWEEVDRSEPDPAAPATRPAR